MSEGKHLKFKQFEKTLQLNFKRANLSMEEDSWNLKCRIWENLKLESGNGKWKLEI